MRKVLKSLLPLFVIDILRRFKSEYKFPEYTSYQDAVDKIGSYNNQKLSDLALKGTLDVKNRKGKSLYPVVLNSYYVLNTCMLDLKKPVNVFELGGALGNLYFNMSKLKFPYAIESWNILEVESKVELGKKHFENDTLKFFSEAQCFWDSSGNKDVFLSIGSIQYMPEPIEFIKSLLQQKFKYLVFDRTILSTNISEIVISHQRSLLKENSPVMYANENNEQIVYPVIYIPEKQFFTLITAHLYKEIINIATREFVVNTEQQILSVKERFLVFELQDI